MWGLGPALRKQIFKKKKKYFTLVCKSPIRKFFGSFHYRKTANLFVCRFINPQIVMINPQNINLQICTKILQYSVSKQS
jgi:hypothetical protein